MVDRGEQTEVVGLHQTPVLGAQAAGSRFSDLSRDRAFVDLLEAEVEQPQQVARVAAGIGDEPVQGGRVSEVLSRQTPVDELS